jgi:hypothetical protein
VEAAHKRNLQVVGWVDGESDLDSAVTAGKSAGLDGVAVRGYRGQARLPVIAWGERANAPWDSTAPVLPVTDNVWPGVAVAGGGADAGAGPTSVPWLDSNGWFIQLARARTSVPVWLIFDPPRGAVIDPQAYALAICDSEAAGGRWVISFDERLRAGLLDGVAAARQTWDQVTRAAGFFAAHTAWRAYRPLGAVGVLSDFAGPHFELSGEILNLMARRDLLFRVIWKSQAASSLAGLKALVYADGDDPGQGLRRDIMSFVEQGGLLVTNRVWGAQGKAMQDAHPRFDMRAFGKGRLALARETISDPYQLAGDTQILLSHANDLVRVYNGSSSGCTHYTSPPGSGRDLLQSLTYASGRQAGVGLRSVWLQRKYRSAALWHTGADRPVPLKVTAAEDFPGVECGLPAMAAQGYFALELEA